MSTGPALAPVPFALAGATLAVAVLLHAGWMPAWAIAGLVALVALRIVQRTLRPVRVPMLVRIALIAGMVLVAWTRFVPLGNRPVFAALLASMLVLKLVETETPRDARLVATFACFLAMSAFLFGQGPVQTGAAALCVVLVFATLHELVPGERDATRPKLRATVGFALRTIALALPFAAIAFVAFPRFESPLWRGSDEIRRGRTGMSDRLEPGQLAAVALDDTPVMRVTFRDSLPAPPERYFRGLVFWGFNGSAWTGEGILRSVPVALEARGPELEYEILMDATEQPWLYLLDAPTAVPEGAQLGGDYTARFRRPITSVTRFTARSTPRYTMQATLSPVLRDWATRTGTGNPRSKALAAEWRARHGADDRAIVDEALSMITRDFVYSLDPPLLGADPVDDFLFSSRIGFCEHFASSFALLMRAAGIPARVVAGFQGGYWNQVGGYLTVLRSDAHAWTELWLDGQGWVRVDPTAAVAPNRIERGSLSLRGAGDEGAFGVVLRDRWDVLGAWWTNAIVRFNALAQRELFAELGIPKATWREMAVVLLAGGAAALALAAVLGFRPARRRRDPVLEAWHRIGARLARAGVARRPNEGPLDYAERAAAALPAEAAAIRALSRRFVALRYAVSPSDADPAAFDRESRAFRPARGATIAPVRAS